MLKISFFKCVRLLHYAKVKGLQNRMINGAWKPIPPSRKIRNSTDNLTCCDSEAVAAWLFAKSLQPSLLFPFLADRSVLHAVIARPAVPCSVVAIHFWNFAGRGVCVRALVVSHSLLCLEIKRMTFLRACPCSIINYIQGFWLSQSQGDFYLKRSAHQERQVWL